MSDVNAPHVIAADRLDGDIVIEFQDGKCGIYSSEFLYAALPQVRPVFEVDPQRQDDDQSGGSVKL